MKFGFGVALLVVGYALLYQGLYMARQYQPTTGKFTGMGVPPLAVLLGFAKPASSKDTFNTEVPSAQAPFVWGTK